MNIHKERTIGTELKVLVAEEPSSPVVNIILMSRAGSRFEREDEAGFAHILEHMLLKGTTRRPSPSAIAKEVDKRGGYFNAFTNKEYLGIVFEVASSHLEDMMELLSDMLFNSLIRPEVLENEKKVIIEEIKRSEENNGSILGKYVFKGLFAGHPLAHRVLGTEESIAKATDSALRAYKEKFMVPGESVLVLTGNIGPNAVELAEKYFGNWKGERPDLLPSKILAAEPKIYFHEKEGPRTSLSCNFYTTRVGEAKEAAALDLVENFLCYGQSSVLKEELRHKRGLVYGVNADNAMFSDAGFFEISASTTKPKEVLAVVRNVITDLPNAFTPNVLKDIKTQTIGSFERYISDPGNQASFLAKAFLMREKFYVPEEYVREINDISHEDVLAVISKYLSPQKAIIFALGPEDPGA